MEITFDPEKNAKNIRERGLSFEWAAEFDFDTAIYRIDNRHDYGETRISALGYLGERLFVLIFVETKRGIRIISFRKANEREVRYYDQKTES